MVVGATDKAQNAEMENARLELFQKHQTSNTIMFGLLEYILLIATAGTLLQVEAVAVRGPPRLITVVPAFTVSSLITAHSISRQVSRICLQVALVNPATSFPVQNRQLYSGNLNSETPGGSKTAFLHWAVF